MLFEQIANVACENYSSDELPFELYILLIGYESAGTAIAMLLKNLYRKTTQFLTKIRREDKKMENKNERLFDLTSLIASNGGPIPISRAGIYAAAAKGDIPTVRIGRRRFVPSWFVDQLLTPPPNFKGA